MRTRDEYFAAHPQQPRGNIANLRSLAQDAIRIDAVTGDEHWDRFLAYLQGAINETRRAKQLQDEKLSDPALVNDEAIRTAKVRAAQLESRIWTLEEILRLPKLLKENAAEAERQIQAMDRGSVSRHYLDRPPLDKGFRKA